ncbi:MAG: methyltransferase [Muribaculaceae bacterium]|nr:methyltransferase [Muribaculaceae bacterium]
MKVGTDGVLLGAWTPLETMPHTILDIGCGSGLIALIMAQRTPMSQKIIGVEIDSDAAADASENASKSPWSEKIEILNQDILQYNPSDLPHPLLIVSNPPFFVETLHSPNRGRELARHGDTFGVKELIQWSASIMTDSDDRLTFISPADRDSEIEFDLSLCRMHALRKCTVYSRQGRKPFRTLWLVAPGVDGTITEELSIRDTSNNLTQTYCSLTSPFYLDK